jgi:hypothetical protein
MRRVLAVLVARLPEGRDVLTWGGLAALCTGVGLYSVPLALIVGGAICFLIGLYASLPRRRA